MSRNTDENEHRPDSDLYYVQDKRAAVGNCMLFWGQNGAGYTCDLDRAGKYTAEQVRGMVSEPVGTGIAGPFTTRSGKIKPGAITIFGTDRSLIIRVTTGEGRDGICQDTHRDVHISRESLPAHAEHLLRAMRIMAVDLPELTIRQMRRALDQKLDGILRSKGGDS